jgi:hypothetical protein
VEYAGVCNAKFVSKDAERYENMIAKAIEEFDRPTGEDKNVVLLGVDGTICRRNTIPRLHKDGIVVMRCPCMEDTDESFGSNNE